MYSRRYRRNIDEEEVDIFNDSVYRSDSQSKSVSSENSESEPHYCGSPNLDNSLTDHQKDIPCSNTIDPVHPQSYNSEKENFPDSSIVNDIIYEKSHCFNFSKEKIKKSTKMNVKYRNNKDFIFKNTNKPFNNNKHREKPDYFLHEDRYPYETDELDEYVKQPTKPFRFRADETQEGNAFNDKLTKGGSINHDPPQEKWLHDRYEKLESGDPLPYNYFHERNRIKKKKKKIIKKPI